MAALVSRPSSLAFGAALAADGLGEGERVADPPDHERARDDVLLVAREHLGLAGLVDAPPHVEQRAPDRWAREASSAGRLGGGAQGTAEARDQHRLPLPHDHRRRAENDSGKRQRADDGPQPALRSHCVNHNSPPSRWKRESTTVKAAPGQTLLERLQTAAETIFLGRGAILRLQRAKAPCLARRLAPGFGAFARAPCSRSSQTEASAAGTV